jgi:hypothetical protein
MQGYMQIKSISLRHCDIFQKELILNYSARELCPFSVPGSSSALVRALSHFPGYRNVEEA